MTFTTFHFAGFFIVTIILGHILKGRWQRIFLLIASYYFYGVYEPVYLWLILISSLYDYIAAIGIESRRSFKSSKSGNWWENLLALLPVRVWLGLSAVLNLSLLGYFKYTNFGIEVMNDVMGNDGSAIGGFVFYWPAINILLPIGISFYTFQSLSYTIDVYRGSMKARRNAVDFLLYVSFFPQLVAGPIVRAETFFRNLDDRLPVNTQDIIIGFSRIVVGFFRKLVLADNLGVVVATGFSPEVYTTLSPVQVWLVSWAFGFQIYFDFAGYTDIARGVARLFGFEFDINFHYPMAASNIKEHWQRWHISLTTWIRDYVYIPLGGSRVSKWRFYCNIFLIWALTGIWHGPAYHFIAWGILQGILLIGHMIYSNTRLHYWLNSFRESHDWKGKTIFFNYAVFSRFLLLFFLYFGFIYFRAPNMQMAHVMIGRGFGLTDFQSQLNHLWEFDFLAFWNSFQFGISNFSDRISGSYWWLLGLVAFYEYFFNHFQLEYFWKEENRRKLIALLCFLILCTLVFALPEAPGFIYFAF